MSKSILKSNVAVSLNSGRVGNVRYYTKDGKTYTRTIYSNVKNQRAEKQMRVRCKVSNIVSMYRALKSLLGKTYEKATSSVSTYNLFWQNAVNCEPIYLTKKQAQMGLCVAAPYGVSNGSLKSIKYSLNEDGHLVSDIELGGLSIDNDTTIGELADAVVNNNANRIQYGDYISFVAVEQIGDAETPDVLANGWNLRLEKGSLEKVYEKINHGFGFDEINGCLGVEGELEPGCYAWILSRKNNGTKVSTQYLFDLNTEMTEAFGSDDQFDDAAESYDVSDDEAFITSDEAEGADGLLVALHTSGAGTATGGGRYAEGAEVTLVATPSTGASFLGWRLGSNVEYESTDLSYTFEVEENVVITAEFSEVVETTMTVAVADGQTARGKIQINSQGLKASDTITAPVGASVRISAVASEGFAFEKWSDNDTNATRNVSASHTTLTASFVEE